MLKKWYEKSELGFALAWIALYVAGMNIALRFCGGLDDLASKTPAQLLVPVICSVPLAALSTAWILHSGLSEKYGLCRFRGDCKTFLWFIPLIAMSCINLKNGLALNAPLAVSLLMMVNMAVAGYVEEIIFRGFLFRAMAKDNLKSAILVSAVTFGAGHIVNLANTADTLGVLLQVGYAVVIGFLYTVIVYRSGSLWPCILSHMFVNGTSVFAPENGPFTALVGAQWAQMTSALVIMLISGSYAIWLWKKTKSL